LVREKFIFYKNHNLLTISNWFDKFLG
jgi:hypothetical protein